MADLINAADSLNAGRGKINAIIKAADAAATTANEAKTTADSVQTQLDTIILDSGTSDAEIVQSRVDKDGNPYQTLKSRLDSEKSIIDQSLVSLGSQLAESLALQTGLLKFKGSDTTANINAKTGMVQGDYWYSTDGLTYYAYTGTAWSNVGSSLTELVDGRITSEGVTYGTIGKNIRSIQRQIGHGKNYFRGTSGTFNGVTISYNDTTGVITTNGTGTLGAHYVIQTLYLTPGSYIIQTDVVGTTLKPAFYVSSSPLATPETRLVVLSNTDDAERFTVVTAGIYYVTNYFGAGVAYNMTFKAQIEFDATGITPPTAIEPYKTEFLSSNYAKKTDLNAYELSTNVEDMDIVFPTKIPVVTGREQNIYFANTLANRNLNDIQGVQVSGVDSVYEDVAKIKVIDGESNSTVYMDYFERDFTHNVQKRATLIPVPSTAGTGTNKKILFIGDSLTDDGTYPTEIANLFTADPMDVTLLGTRGTTNKHEGRAGWRAWNYAFEQNASADGVATGATNPFYNPAISKFDFAYFMGNQGYTDVQQVYIALGSNDKVRATHTSDADVLLAWNTIINSIHAYDPTIKIVLWLCPPTCLLDGVGKRIWTIIRAMQMRKLLLTTYSNKEANKIYLCPVYLNVDPIYDFLTQTVAISDRNSKTRSICLDYTHPLPTGYYKIADSLFSMIKYLATLA